MLLFKNNLQTIRKKDDTIFTLKIWLRKWICGEIWNLETLFKSKVFHMDCKWKKTWSRVEAEWKQTRNFVDMTFSAFKWPTTCFDGSNNKLRYCFQFTLITHIIFAKARIFKNIYQFTTFCSIIICFIFSNFANLVSNQYLAFL